MSSSATRARRLASTAARATSSSARASTAVEGANRARDARRRGTNRGGRRDDDDDDEKDARKRATDATTREAYVAALGDTVRKVKVLSLASLAATVVGCPTFVELSQPELAFEAKAAVNATVIGFGGFTTALLQWFISPYVRSMRLDASKRDGDGEEIEVERERIRDDVRGERDEGERKLETFGVVGGGWEALLRGDGDGAKIYVR